MIPGIVVRLVDDVPETLPNSVPYSPNGEVAGGELLIRAAGVGRCRISGGNTIDFRADEGASPSAVERFLRGNALAALIHQRGELPLHASAMLSANGARALVFCGLSGAGKSTMAATLARQGWTFLTDDIARITFGESGLWVWPSGAGIRLLPDACERLAIDISDRERDGKIMLPIEPPARPGRLAAIVSLGGSERLPRLERLTGAAAVSAIVGNMPGPRKMRAMGRLSEHLALMQRVVTQCPVYRLHGRQTASAGTLCRLISRMAE